MSIEKVIQLRKQNKKNEAKELMETLILLEPDNPYYNYQMAWCNDSLGKEKEAIQYYVRAIDLGLIGEDLLGAYIGLGSSYRTLGEYKKAKTLFETAMKQFPNNNTLKTFYLIVLYNLKDYKNSVSLLLKLLIKTSSDEEIKSFSGALDFYSDNLDEIF